jgi:cyclin T
MTAVAMYTGPPGAYVMEGGYSQGYGEHSWVGSQASGHMPLSVQHSRAEEEMADALENKKRRKSRFQYRTLEELEKSSPSTRDGLDPDKEKQWRRQYVKLINAAGQALRV